MTNQELVPEEFEEFKEGFNAYDFIMAFAMEEQENGKKSNAPDIMKLAERMKGECSKTVAMELFDLLWEQRYLH